MKHKSLSILIAIAIIFSTLKAGFLINDGLQEITTKHSPTLTTIQQMEADIFEGITETYSYILLDDEGEKEEFYEKSADFDLVAQEYNAVASQEDEEKEAQSVSFNEVVEAKAKFVTNTEEMFTEYEKLGYAPRPSVVAVEESIIELTQALNYLVEVEKLELDEHVEELEQTVKQELTILLILSSVLLLSLLRDSKKKK